MTCPHPLSRHEWRYLSPFGDGEMEGVAGRRVLRCEDCSCEVSEGEDWRQKHGPEQMEIEVK